MSITDIPEDAYPVQETQEAREAVLIALAESQAEKMLREGNAPAAIVVHYLRLGTAREKAEVERIKSETAAANAKTSAIKAAEESGERYLAAIEAMKMYSGSSDDSDVQ